MRNLNYATLKMVFPFLYFACLIVNPVGVKKAPVKLSIAKRRTKYNSRGFEPTVNEILLCSGIEFLNHTMTISTRQHSTRKANPPLHTADYLYF